MKTFKFSFVTFTCAVAVFAILFFASCQKEQLQPEIAAPVTEQELPMYSKDVAFTDASGKNTAVVRISTDNASFLEEEDLSKLLRIEPVFELDSEESHSGQEPNGESEMTATISVNFEIISQQLEPGAVALRLVFDQNSNGAVQERVPFYLLMTITTTKDHVHVSITTDCAQVFSYWSFDGTIWLTNPIIPPLSCAPTATKCIYKPGTAKIKLNIYGYSTTVFSVVAY